MNPLLVAIPYCSKDSQSAGRLLEWIHELDSEKYPACLLAADAAVPQEEKVRIHNLAKSAFVNVDTMIVSAPTVKDNYHVAAAFMFNSVARQVQEVYKWNFLWLEPDAIPLKPGWLDSLTNAYNNQPKRFMGALIETNQPNVPKIHLAGVAIYPNCAHSDLSKFCDGTKGAFDMQMAEYVVPRGTNTPLLFHRFGQLNDPPTFKAVKEPTDGPNVGTLASIPAEAVLMHRNKDQSLIPLLRQRLAPPSVTITLPDGTADMVFHERQPEPPKRRGRPPKIHPEPVTT